MAGNPNWWSMHPPSQQPSALLSSSPSIFPSQYVLGSSPFPSNSLPDNQELPHQSWSQLLLGGSSGDEDRYGLSQFQPKKLGNWEDQILNSSPSISLDADIKQENSHSSNLYGHVDEDFQEARPTAWPQAMPVSSTRSCVTSLSSSTSILDFSYSKADGTNQNPDQSSECNSTATGGVCKKARVQPSPSQPLKVRKEKLGDRITALHQMVSPFGKTDTASVLLEAIGYIRFLQGQIEALSTAYLGSASPNMRNQQHSDNQDQLKDLRSRGLCLVPVSCTQHVGSDNGAHYWAPTIGGGF